VNFKSIISSLFTIKTKKNLGEASRHAKRAYRKRFSFSHAVFTVTIVFLFLPLLVLIAYSFNGSTSMNWTGFSLRWYQRLLESRELWRAFRNSLLIATTSAFSATVIGTMGAIGINWYKFKMRGYIQAISFLPMILPEIIIGVSLSIFFAGIGVPLVFLPFISPTLL